MGFGERDSQALRHHFGQAGNLKFGMTQVLNSNISVMTRVFRSANHNCNSETCLSTFFWVLTV